MKRFLIVFLFIILFSFCEVKAEEKYASTEWIPAVFYSYRYNGVSYWGQMAYIKIDGKISYCIDIKRNITTDPYLESSEFSVDNEIVLYAYFGYGYLNNNLNDYLAAQKLIWKKLGVEVSYTTASGGNGNTINVDSNINKIKGYIEEYKKELTLDNDFNFEIGNVDTIYMNKSSNNYVVENNSNNIISIDNNNINISSLEIGNNTFKLKENYEYKYKNSIYVSNNSQTIIQVGNIINKEYQYNYTVKGGKLEINLKNSITNSSDSLGSEKLDNNVFNLYDNNYTLIGTYETDKDGRLVIDQLYNGEYILEHLFVSEGYLKEKTVYNINMSSNNLEQEVEISLKPKNITFFITKNYGNPKVGTLFSDNNVSFDFYNSKGEMVSKVTTDDNGKTSTNLFYDEYLVKQNNTNNVEEKSQDYIINKSDFSGNNYYNIYTPVYDSKLKLYLYELGSTIPISNAKITISGKEYTTDKEGVIITDYLKEGTNCIYQSNFDNYVINNDVCVDINENSDFYIQDNDAFVDFVMYNEKKIIEEIPEVIKKEVVTEKEDIANINYLNVEEVIQETIKEEDINILPNLFSKFFEIKKGLYKC